MSNDAKGSLKSRIRSLATFVDLLLSSHPWLDGHSWGKHSQAASWWAEPFGARWQAAWTEPSGYGSSVWWHNRAETAWRDLLESEILSGKTSLSLAENKNGKVPASAAAGHNHGGPRSVLKAFCSGTVHLQFIESFFQREAADRASHGFQCESSTQTNLCRLHCQLLSQEKKPAWGQAVKCREHNSFWQGNPLACTKGSQRENWDPPLQQLWN